MANPRRNIGYVSLRHLEKKFGFNLKHLRLLIKSGYLVGSGSTGVLESGLDNLIEGEHYVICHHCKSYQSEITLKHLKFCGNQSVEEYLQAYPEATLRSTFTALREKKTQVQKLAQSACLIKRFKTVEGEITRKEISEAAKKLMQTPYREVASNHLRKMVTTSEFRSLVGEQSRKRWATEEFREKIENWIRDNKPLVLESAAHARSFLKSTYTKPHRLVHEALVSEGLSPEVEYRFGYYHIDLAFPNLKLAVEVDGCYWHGCSKCNFPGRRYNLALDRRKTSYLEARGWTVIRIKEHEVSESDCITRVLDCVRGS